MADQDPTQFNPKINMPVNYQGENISHEVDIK